MKDLAEAIIKLRDAATFINQLADELDTGKTGNDREAPVKPKVTLEEVRGVLAEKAGLGFTAEVKELLKKHGGKRLSEIAETDYAGLKTDAEVLGNGS